jgi:hypothetical protein
MHARLGEVLYMAATAGEAAAERYLAESLRRFCRSIELCDDYLRGYYGLKLVRMSENMEWQFSHTYHRPAHASLLRYHKHRGSLRQILECQRQISKLWSV